MDCMMEGEGKGCEYATRRRSSLPGTMDRPNITRRLGLLSGHRNRAFPRSGPCIKYFGCMSVRGYKMTSRRVTSEIICAEIQHLGKQLQRTLLKRILNVTLPDEQQQQRTAMLGRTFRPQCAHAACADRHRQVGFALVTTKQRLSPRYSCLL